MTVIITPFKKGYLGGVGPSLVFPYSENVLELSTIRAVKRYEKVLAVIGFLPLGEEGLYVWLQPTPELYLNSFTAARVIKKWSEFMFLELPKNYMFSISEATKEKTRFMLFMGFRKTSDLIEREGFISWIRRKR